MILFGGMVKIVGAWSASQECMSLGGVLYYWIGRSLKCVSNVEQRVAQGCSLSPIL